MSSRLRTALLCTLAFLASFAVVITPASAAYPHIGHGFGSAIEGPAPYQPQKRCAPYVRPGTKQLGTLLVNTYPKTVWYSTRPCDGSVSEHFDGRAIDWMVAAHVAWQRADAHDLLTWLLATDRYGHEFAMARRLGVMYVIFNNRMWGSWNNTWVDYNGCTAPKMQAPKYANACHRTHIHISLDWHGAMAETSFWTGHV
ncbi:MAG: hypothetical protein M3070_00445 [Actinomycetota bacterium]|nr:hypothetical protein [Actinomycetota bacterium]